MISRLQFVSQESLPHISQCDHFITFVIHLNAAVFPKLSIVIFDTRDSRPLLSPRRTGKRKGWRDHVKKVGWVMKHPGPATQTIIQTESFSPKLKQFELSFNVTRQICSGFDSGTVNISYILGFKVAHKFLSNIVQGPSTDTLAFLHFIVAKTLNSL